MRRLLLITIISFSAAVSLFAKDWTFTISPLKVKMCSVKGLHRPQYFVEKCGIKNMVNLSFFTSKTFIPPYKDLDVTNLRNPKKWPFLTIEGDGFAFLYDGKQLTHPEFDIVRNETKFIASGYPILLQDGHKTKIKNTFFTRRRCPRTAVGILPDRTLVIYVTTSATLKELQNHFAKLGCIDAINFDGGSSTFLYLDGKKVYSSNHGRSYPNVLYWE